jgi:hypothetical protein
MRIASPERWWRAAASPLLAGWIGWYLSGSFRPSLRPGAVPGLPLVARIIVTGLAVGIGLVLAVLITRTHLSVSDDGVADHRIFRVIRVPWPLITGFEVGRPRALWEGFCVIATCGDGETVDLMSTRVYSRIASAQHLGELQRMRCSLEEAAAQRAG